LNAGIFSDAAAVVQVCGERVPLDPLPEIEPHEVTVPAIVPSLATEYRACSVSSLHPGVLEEALTFPPTAPLFEIVIAVPAES
jgi:hypothetical protein